ncbi:transcriptional regulator [Paenibacillus sp. LMG 31456]|uniref:Transcriptional regulator n=1 Tax=Paenibacillus foliorum TaxID=2654974 RepID=A0A972K368_9BACL|nr:helix-turn-helix domain-containing protein [Paenibacillus foliorum]NOU96670.1 transcriptional regulator [Paenibacillus foliorum]
MDLDFLRTQSGYNEEDIDCYIHVWTTIQAIGGKWKMLILWHVNEGGRRYNELRRLIPGISQKVLTQHLKELEQDGLISRKVFPEMPPRVEYQMSPYGKTLEPIFEIMYDWGVNHRARNTD